jgi:predicted acyltransferase
MSLLRRIEQDGRQAAYRAAVRRYLILAGLGCLYGGLHFRAGVWDALMDIGCSGLLALPFLERSARVRLAAAILYLTLYQTLYSYTGYGAWVVSRSINGGPLGPLSWVFMLLLGSLAGDLILQGGRRRLLLHALGWAVALSALGWAFRAEWPGWKAFWPFSPYMMSVPFPLYATGLAFALMAGFYLLCDVAGWQFPHLTLLGRNPLVLYLLQALLVVLVRVIFPSETGVAGALLVFAGVYAACYLTAWLMHRRGIIVKI